MSVTSAAPDGLAEPRQPVPGVPRSPSSAATGSPVTRPRPRDLVAEVRRAEQLGLGAVFLSERFNTKDAAVMAGAAAAVSSSIGIGTAATNHNTRHPMVTATMAVTAHRMSGGRYALGLGRGFDVLFDLMGLPRVTGAQLEDVVGLYRRLWHGEAFDHDGPAGRFPFLSLDSSYDEDIPVLMMAIGGRTLELAGRVADGVVLHTFLGDETLARSVATIRAAAERAGRDPQLRAGVGRAGHRHRRPARRRRGCASWSAAWRRTSRATARCWCGPTAGTSPRCSGSATTPWCRATPARSTPSAPPSS